MSKVLTKDYKEDASLAVAEEEKAKTQPEEGVYIHKFEKPFTYNNNSVPELVFDWDILTGGDYDGIEAELVREGITLVLPEYTGSFLAHMAVRSCTTRNVNGLRFVDREFLRAIPIRDYKALLGKARSFLLRRGSM